MLFRSPPSPPTTVQVFIYIAAVCTSGLATFLLSLWPQEDNGPWAPASPHRPPLSMTKLPGQRQVTSEPALPTSSLQPLLPPHTHTHTHRHTHTHTQTHTHTLIQTLIRGCWIAHTLAKRMLECYHNSKPQIFLSGKELKALESQTIVPLFTGALLMSSRCFMIGRAHV